jgi:hypothetical protein
MTGTARELLTWAAAQVRVKESPAGSNKQGYAALAGHANGQPWCATFLVAGWKKNGVPLVPGTDSPSTPMMQKAFKRADRLFDEPRAGDAGFVFYPELDGGRIGHVFFVERVDGDYVKTIEGNTNLDGSRTGIGVYRHRRKWRGSSSIRGFGRPLYARAEQLPVVVLQHVVFAAGVNAMAPQGSVSRPEDVRIVEAALLAEGLLSPRYAKDGSFGTETITAYSQWQRKLGFTGDDADGVPGPDSLKKLGARHGFRVRP